MLLTNENKHIDLDVIDYTNKNLSTIPEFSHNHPFELILSNNNFKSLSNPPSNCLKLNISNNRISSFSKNLQQNYSLLTLDISYNRLISISGINSLHKLKEINLSNNYLYDEQLDFLSSLNIKQLDLSNNSLKSSNDISNLISKLKKLERLNISNNHYEELIFNLSSKTLQKLELDSNKIVTLTFLNKFYSLTYLSISNNQLGEIFNAENISNLEYILLNDNLLSRLDFLKHFKKIKFLNINNNLLSKNENTTDMDFSFKQLEVLELSNNNIYDLSNFHIFDNDRFPVLRSIRLDNNKLNELRVSSSSFKSLEILFIQNNILEDCDFLRSLVNLSTLNISFNRILNVKSLYKQVGNLINLKELILIENNFNKDLYNLEILFSECLFDSIDDFLSYSNSTPKKDILLRYRSDVINKNGNIEKLDGISISHKERTNICRYETKSKKSTVQSINTIENKVQKDQFHDDVDSNYDDYKRREILRINLEDKEDRVILTKKDIEQPYSLTKSNNSNQIKNSLDRYINKAESKAESKLITEQSKESSLVINKIIETMQNIQESNGFIKYDNLKDLLKDIIISYSLTDQLDSFKNDIRKELRKSLILNKIHINEIKSLLVRNVDKYAFISIINDQLNDNNRFPLQQSTKIEVIEKHNRENKFIPIVKKSFNEDDKIVIKENDRNLSHIRNRSRSNNSHIKSPSISNRTFNNNKYTTRVLSVKNNTSTINYYKSDIISDIESTSDILNKSILSVNANNKLSLKDLENYLFDNTIVNNQILRVLITSQYSKSNYYQILPSDPEYRFIFHLFKQFELCFHKYNFELRKLSKIIIDHITNMRSNFTYELYFSLFDAEVQKDLDNVNYIIENNTEFSILKQFIENNNICISNKTIVNRNNETFLFKSPSDLVSKFNKTEYSLLINLVIDPKENLVYDESNKCFICCDYIKNKTIPLYLLCFNKIN